MPPKRRGKHREKALTALRVRSLSSPGRHLDGAGLYLLVKPSGAKSWVQRITVGGRRRDVGLGSVRDVSLAEARDRSYENRRLVRDGKDPITGRRRTTPAVPTFAEAARQVHAEHSGAWRNPKHRGQWLSSLEAHVFPVIGQRAVDQVETADVLRALQGIWLTHPETARRVRQRMRLIFDWARAQGYRDGENPVGTILQKALPRHSQAARRHFPALPYPDVPNFVQRLRGGEGGGEVPRLAFEFLILTATRTSEVLGASAAEFDLDREVWTIPADRMKARRAFRVPLSRRAFEVVRRACELSSGSGVLFEGARPGKPLSNMAFLMALRRMRAPATAHGFRSSFRDWAAETTSFANEVVEMALAHTIKSAVERAYRRGDLFDRRRELMEAWAGFLMGEIGNVVPMRQQLSA